jgi:PleD family two-component response regulator
MHFVRGLRDDRIAGTKGQWQCVLEKCSDELALYAKPDPVTIHSIKNAVSADRQRKTTMVNANSLKLYLAVKKHDDRSRMEDTLVLDGFNIRTFPTATELWEAFRLTPARLVISERRFADGFTGLHLVSNIRQHHPMPYVYTVVLSIMANLKEMKEALAVGVDDYLVRPHNPFQLRSRALVGMRWLNYIDSLYEDKSEKK